MRQRYVLTLSVCVAGCLTAHFVSASVWLGLCSSSLVAFLTVCPSSSSLSWCLKHNYTVYLFICTHLLVHFVCFFSSPFWNEIICFTILFSFLFLILNWTLTMHNLFLIIKQCLFVLYLLWNLLRHSQYQSGLYCPTFHNYQVYFRSFSSHGEVILTDIRDCVINITIWWKFVFLRY